jgi:uncharacterized protein (TIGR03000 family)
MESVPNLEKEATMYSTILTLALAGSADMPEHLFPCRYYTPCCPVVVLPWCGPIYAYPCCYCTYPCCYPWGYPPVCCSGYWRVRFSAGGYRINPCWCYGYWAAPAYWEAPIPWKTTPEPPPAKTPGKPKEPELKKKAGIAPQSSSLVTIRLPAGANLLVDGQPAPKTDVEKDGVKTFRTPLLAEGAIHSYTFAVEVTENDRKVTKSQLVRFRAGDPVAVDFTVAPAIATARR